MAIPEILQMALLALPVVALLVALYVRISGGRRLSRRPIDPPRGQLSPRTVRVKRREKMIFGDVRPKRLPERKDREPIEVPLDITDVPRAGVLPPPRDIRGINEDDRIT